LKEPGAVLNVSILKCFPTIEKVPAILFSVQALIFAATESPARVIPYYLVGEKLI